MESTDPSSSKSKPQYKRPVGPYVPPAKRVKSEKFDVGSEDHQRLDWDEHKKKINGLINRANYSNVTVIIKELFKCNLVRYKGIFASALLKAQETSPKYTEVYAAILAVINSRIKTIGALVVNRLILQFRLAFLGNNKQKCLASIKFIAHLTNQEVVHEVLGFQVIDLLIGKPNASSLEMVIEFIKECGAKLEILNSSYLFEIFKTLRDLSLEQELDTRTQVQIDLIHTIRKNKFKDFLPVKQDLDLVEEDDKVTHKIELTEPKKEDFHMEFNYFKLDPNWAENEAKYHEFQSSLFGDGSDADNSSDDSDGEDHDGGATDNSDADVKLDQNAPVIDKTGADLVEFRKNVYLTFRSSVRHEEVVHRLMRSGISPELHDELCQMILDCCGQERTYGPIYGLVASKICEINRRTYAPIFEKLFQLFYETVHKFETNKIRNISKFYAHLLTTESIDWSCMSCLKLREEGMSSAGRCFIKFLFEELIAKLSRRTMLEYIEDPSKSEGFVGLFPKDDEQDIRFAINFFTLSGFGELTQGLRQELLSRQ